MADVPKSVPTASHLHRKHTYDQLLCMPLIPRRGSAVALSASALDLALRGNSLDKTSSTDKNEEQKDPAAFAAEHYNTPSNHCHSENLCRLGHRKPLQSLPKMTSANGDAQRLCHCGLLETRDAEPHPAGALDLYAIGFIGFALYCRSGGERRWSRRGGMLVLAGHVPSFYVSWLPKESGPWEAQPEIGGQEEGRIQNISPLLPCLWLGLCSGCNSSS